MVAREGGVVVDAAEAAEGGGELGTSRLVDAANVVTAEGEGEEEEEVVVV